MDWTNLNLIRWDVHIKRSSINGLQHFRLHASAWGLFSYEESLMSQLRTLPRREVPPAVPRTTSTFELSAQVIATGPQDSTVQATAPLVGTGRGQIAVRIGRLLVYVTDRE